MKLKYLIWLQFSLLFICNSCETKTKFELPSVDPVLAVLSSNDLDYLFQVRVTLAKPFKDPLYPVNSDCHVKLFENDNPFAELKQDTITVNNGENGRDKVQGYPERIYIKDTAVKFDWGKKYRIEVNIPDYPTLSATTYIPNPVKIKSITWIEFNGSMPYWYFDRPVEILVGPADIRATPPLIEWTITFDDPPTIENYYRIGVGFRAMHHKDDSTSYFIDGKVQYAPSNSNDPVFMYVINRSPIPNTNPDDIYYTVFTKEILFSDNNFEGKEYSVKILTPRPGDIKQMANANDSFKYIINLYSLSEDYYKYWLDRYKVEKLSDDPFSEPIRVHSNINNGAGIFAFSSFDSDTLQVDINY